MSRHTTIMDLRSMMEIGLLFLAVTNVVAVTGSMQDKEAEEKRVAAAKWYPDGIEFPFYDKWVREHAVDEYPAVEIGKPTDDLSSMNMLLGMLCSSSDDQIVPRSGNGDCLQDILNITRALKYQAWSDDTMATFVQRSTFLVARLWKTRFRNFAVRILYSCALVNKPLQEIANAKNINGNDLRVKTREMIFHHPVLKNEETGTYFNFPEDMWSCNPEKQVENDGRPLELGDTLSLMAGVAFATKGFNVDRDSQQSIWSTMPEVLENLVMRVNCMEVHPDWVCNLMATCLSVLINGGDDLYINDPVEFAENYARLHTVFAEINRKIQADEKIRDNLEGNATQLGEELYYFRKNYDKISELHEQLERKKKDLIDELQKTKEENILLQKKVEELGLENEKLTDDLDVVRRGIEQLHTRLADKGSGSRV